MLLRPVNDNERQRGDLGCRGGTHKEEDRRVLEDDPGNGDCTECYGQRRVTDSAESELTSLLLSSTQSLSALSDPRLVLLGERHDSIVNRRCPCCFEDVLVGRVEVPVVDVVSNLHHRT